MRKLISHRSTLPNKLSSYEVYKKSYAPTQMITFQKRFIYFIFIILGSVGTVQFLKKILTTFYVIDAPSSPTIRPSSLCSPEECTAQIMRTKICPPMTMEKEVKMNPCKRMKKDKPFGDDFKFMDIEFNSDDDSL